ncbi:tetratricopeptide repeat protein [Algoriphagus sp. PAP.12]|uniref:tetratricopeptide repeat protein n=1 Tax=Algoriphagus sp. PAP.12 TaxID=2996678 RepID=UPI00227C1C9C|nr:tetratricopeptide repeat protein [Algoriphagus sp. PAP.12]
MKSYILYILVLISSCTIEHSDEFDKLTTSYFKFDELGNYDSARIIGEASLELAQKYFEPFDTRTAQAHNNMAEMLRELGQLTSAIPHYQKAIEIWTVNKDSLLLARANQNLGLLYLNGQEYENASIHLSKSIDLLEGLHLDKDERIITPKTILGYIAIAKNDLDKAEDYFMEALVLTEAHYSTNEIEFGQIYRDLFFLYFHQRKFDRSYEYLTKSREIFLKNFDPTHPTMATLYSHLGSYFHVQNEIDSAEYYYLKSLSIRAIQTDRINSKAFQTLKNLGRLYTDQGDSINAKKYIDLANSLESL